MAKFLNVNTCNSFTTFLKGTSIHRLSAAECSEVIFVNNTGNIVKVYDDLQFGHSAVANVQQYMEIAAGGTFTFRGLTDSDELSASSAATGNDIVTYRTQYYSTFPQR